MVPEAITTAGPVNSESPSVIVTPTVPPGTRTVTVPVDLPSAARWAAATATVPVPQERVSPTPLSCTRMATLSGPRTTTNSMFTPLGNTSESNSGCTVRSSVVRSSVTQTRCGLPTSTATPTNSRPATWADEVTPSVAGPISIVTSPAAGTSAVRVPPRVANITRPGGAHPASTR